MTQFDVLVLVIYLIVVTIVLLRVFRSLNDVYQITVDDTPPNNQPSLKTQLEKQNLQDQVEIKFGFDNRYEYNKLDRIPIEIINKSEHNIYVDWDECSLTDFVGKSRRVIRPPTDIAVTLFPTQAASAVAPGKALKEKLTTEDVLKREDDNNVTIKSQPVVDVSKLKGGSKPEKALYTDFHEFGNPIYLYMRLVFRVFDPTSQRDDRDDKNYRFHSLVATFRLQKLPWYAGLPFNPKR